MVKPVYYVETLHHFHKEENLYARITLTQLEHNAYEVKVMYADTIDFATERLESVYIMADLHEAMNYARECYTQLLREGYCYWGLIPPKQIEQQRSAEKNRLFQIVRDYCNEEAAAELEAWRTQQAKEEGIHPHYVFSNRVIRVFATFLPQTEEELQSCPGFGKSKQHYSEDILRICSKYERQFSTPLPTILPKYKFMKNEEIQFAAYRGRRFPAEFPEKLREQARTISTSGKDTHKLVRLSRCEDWETRKWVAFAVYKLNRPDLIRSVKHLLFDEKPYIRQYMLLAIRATHLHDEMRDDVARLLGIEPKQYNRQLCAKILNNS